MKTTTRIASVVGLLGLLVAAVSIWHHFATTSARFATSRSTSIGLMHPPLPAGIALEGSSTLGPAATSQWSFAEVKTFRSRELWLNRRTNDGQSIPIWTVTDVLALPLDSADLVFVVNLCGIMTRDLTPEDTANGAVDRGFLTPDSTVVAIVRRSAAIVNTTVVGAWRADLGMGRFEAIGVERLGCINDTPKGGL